MIRSTRSGPKRLFGVDGMATIPHVSPGDRAMAQDQNALIDQVNTNTEGIDANAAAVDTLRSYGPGRFHGAWTDDGSGAGTVVDASVSGGVRIVDVGATSLESSVGCSMNEGTLTVDETGMWLLNFSVQFQGGPTAVRAIYVARGSANEDPSGAKFGLLGVPEADSMSSSTRLELEAGDTVSLYAAVWSDEGSVRVWRSEGNNFTATFLGQPGQLQGASE